MPGRWRRSATRSASTPCRATTSLGRTSSAPRSASRSGSGLSSPISSTITVPVNSTSRSTRVAVKAGDRRKDADPGAMGTDDLARSRTGRADVYVFDAAGASRAIGIRALLDAGQAAIVRRAPARALVAPAMVRLAPWRRNLLIRVEQALRVFPRRVGVKVRHGLGLPGRTAGCPISHGQRGPGRRDSPPASPHGRRASRDPSAAAGNGASA
jgi:hypothetical protein